MGTAAHWGVFEDRTLAAVRDSKDEALAVKRELHDANVRVFGNGHVRCRVQRISAERRARFERVEASLTAAYPAIIDEAA